MIDVHIGVSGKENPTWLARCLESLQGQPVCVHFVDAVPDGVGTMRAAGYSLGSNSLVSYVDPDDWVAPWLYTWAADVMEDPSVSACYANHGVYAADGETKTGMRFDRLAPAVGFAQAKQMHHAVVHRRSIIEPVLPLLSGCQIYEYRPVNLQSLLRGRVVGTEREGYGWRVHDRGVHKQNRRLRVSKLVRRWCMETQATLLARGNIE